MMIAGLGLGGGEQVREIGSRPGSRRRGALDEHLLGPR
jgi:hypothetical protein